MTVLRCQMPAQNGTYACAREERFTDHFESEVRAPAAVADLFRSLFTDALHD